ncbi:MAG: dihydrolipoamide acetyltransferase family protein [Ilumatobacter sp.]|uniref:dihydrolipoamide acetyltransferase family protein n=1 Tax=Ilumatobacter sp. TaxID=1967498 RepID=UPI003C756658
MTYSMKLPDVGEGVAEAELVEWLIAVGDRVTPDSALVEVLTDKATVEVSCPVSGVVTALHGEPGDVLAVGNILIEIDTGDADVPDQLDEDSDPVLPDPPEAKGAEVPGTSAPSSGREVQGSARRPTAAPAVRRRASELGMDLASVTGSGPDGRILHADLDAAISGGASRPKTTAADRSDGSHREPVRGIRRRIAERLTAAWTEIPHITYVESVDVTELERLRAELNRSGAEGSPARLTILPFVTMAVAMACSEQPVINSHYDHAEQVLTKHDGVHVGIATQTDSGLMVPVVRDADTRRLRDLAGEIVRVTEAARDGSATRHDLSGSTITITSLGAIGGVATTPILNPPEVAIVGVNKIDTQPVWRVDRFEPRQVLNLSSSFDHRMVDGWDAATFVQRVKALIETPALLFLDD